MSIIKREKTMSKMGNYVVGAEEDGTIIYNEQENCYEYTHTKGRGSVRKPLIRKIWRSICPILVPIVPKRVLLAVRQVTKGAQI